MFENNQLTVPLAYILVLVMCLVSLVLLSAARWLARDLCGKPKLAFHALFGFMLVVDLIWSLHEYTGHQTKLLTFAANAVWYVSFVWICSRWHEDCLQNLNALRLKRWIPRPVRQHREKGFTGILLKPITQDGVQKLCRGCEESALEGLKSNAKNG